MFQVVSQRQSMTGSLYGPRLERSGEGVTSEYSHETSRNCQHKELQNMNNPLSEDRKAGLHFPSNPLFSRSGSARTLFSRLYREQLSNSGTLYISMLLFYRWKKTFVLFQLAVIVCIYITSIDSKEIILNSFIIVEFWS